jgi:glycosyltransferase involved in cell wall biosynthesis
MVIFVCSPGNGFPNGRAETSRLTNLAKGLLALGEEVCVLCHVPSDDPRMGVLNTVVRGEFAGIPFEYSCGRTVRGETFVARRRLRVTGYVKAARIALELLKDRPLRTVYLYQSDSLVREWVFFLVAKMARATYVTDVNELPFYQSGRGSVTALYAAVYRRVAFKVFDGILVISEELGRYVKPHMRRRAQLLRMPILVDPDEFAKPPEGKELLPERRYVMYFGPLNEYKDGVVSLMKAFGRVADEFPDVDLALVGDYSRDGRASEFERIAEELGILDRIAITGPVEREDVPRYLHQATVLALARPASRQAVHNFPTKLGEYLATGKPVVVTRAGEIDEYLEDGVSAFLVAPGDSDVFASRLRDVLSSPDAARQVGRGGQEVARREFDYRRNGRRLRSFIVGLAAGSGDLE